MSEDRITRRIRRQNLKKDKAKRGRKTFSKPKYKRKKQDWEAIECLTIHPT